MFTLIFCCLAQLIASEVNPAQDFLLSGVIAGGHKPSKFNRAKAVEQTSDVAIIKDTRSEKTHILKVGDLIPSTVAFYVLEISKSGVKIGNGNLVFDIKPAPISNGVEIVAKTEKNDSDEQEPIESFETIEELLESLRQGDNSLNRKL